MYCGLTSNHLLVIGKWARSVKLFASCRVSFVVAMTLSQIKASFPLPRRECCRGISLTLPSAVTLIVTGNLSLSAQGPTTSLNEWTWVGGSHSIPQFGNYGSLGVAAPGNLPGSREGASTWVDKNGNFWLFGGLGYYSVGGPQHLNDLWEYTPSTGLWTWEQGPLFGEQSGVYGTQAVPAASNLPGGRFNAAQWTDGSGNLWLFGGNGYDASGNLGYLNDLWEFNIATRQWVWQGGSEIMTQFSSSLDGYGSAGSYGTEGSASSTNHPPGREMASYAADTNGNLVLFGGHGVFSSTTSGTLNDLWMYNIASKMWTWIAGSATPNQSDSYGMPGVSYDASVHFPGARSGGALWADKSGVLWLFGGYHNDLWKIDTAAGQVTWVDGSQAENAYGSYGTMASPGKTNIPGTRADFAYWADDNGDFWLFGGVGYDASGNFGFLNDLWMFNPQNELWTWENGSQTADIAGKLANYGVQGVPATTNEPEGLWLSMNWTDSYGNFWLYSGGATTTGNNGVILDDLWVYQPLALTQESQTISFTALNDVAATTASVVLSASASSGLQVSFASNTPSVCIVNGTTAAILAFGACSITATQVGNSTYAAATPVTQTFHVVSDFTVAVSGPGTITIKPGGTATFNFILAGVPTTTSLQNTAVLSYAVSPSLGSGYVVSLTPTSIPPGSGSTHIALVISSPRSAVRAPAPEFPTGGRMATLALCLLLPVVGGLRRGHRQPRLKAMLLLLLLSGVAILGLNGCGASSQSSGSPISYDVVVTATSGPISHSASVALLAN